MSRSNGESFFEYFEVNKGRRTQFISTIDFLLKFLYHLHRHPYFTGGVSKFGYENPQI